MTDRPPRAVREASKRADELHAEIYSEEGDQGDQVQEPTGESQAEGTEQAQTPPTEQAGEVNPLQEQAAQPATPPVNPEETIDHWRNKFRTLEGKYRAEVPRYSSQVRELNGRIQHLEGTLAALQQPAVNNNDNTPTKSLVTPEEVEEYGEDFVSMMRRLAQEEAGRVVQQVAPKIQEVEGRLQQTVAQTQSDRVYAQLDTEIENWRDINRSREFLDWLSQDDPYAGTTRAIMLRDAFDQKDPHRVVSFFNGFLSERMLVSPPPPTTPTPADPPARKPEVDLAALAGPRGGNGGVPSASPEGPQPWTRRQIAAFYHDVQMGAYKNDPQKKARIEGSMNRAVQAGLVTP